MAHQLQRDGGRLQRLFKRAGKRADFRRSGGGKKPLLHDRNPERGKNTENGLYHQQNGGRQYPDQPAFRSGRQVCEGSAEGDVAPYELYPELDSAHCHLCGAGTAYDALHAEADGRRKRHVLRQEQRQGLRLGANRKNLRRRGRAGRGQGSSHRDCRFSAQSAEI